MVSLISLEETLSLRSRVLRNGQIAPANCINEGDDQPDTFHTGWKENGQILGIATFMRENLEGESGQGFRLRGMAVAPEYQGRGLGAKVLELGMEKLKSEGINYLWCNARKVAYDFYVRQGFEFLSEEFEIAGIGPHKVMRKVFTPDC